MKRTTLFAATLTVLALAATLGLAEKYPWQEDQIRTLPSGDMQWAPKPFEFQAGDVVRFIDYENGDDNADGKTKQTAWKHHPWDRNSAGKAAEYSGVTTYIFRRGVIYRGGLSPDESGKEGDPIRLTASAKEKGSPHYWGEGEAYLFGTRRLPARWVKAEKVEHPERIPNIGKVWAIDLKGIALMEQDKDTGRYSLEMDMTGTTRNRGVSMPYMGLFRIDDEMGSHQQHLARTPDWQMGNDNFVLDYWHIVDRASHTREKNAQGKPAQGGLIDEDVLKGHPEDWFIGGYIWPQYAHFMGTPKPKYIPFKDTKRGVEYKVYDPEQAALNIGGIYGDFRPGLRYMVENLPQYLDAEEEFYFDTKTGYLFYLPFEGKDPNQLSLELTSVTGGIVIKSQSHIDINGLEFRYFDSTGVGIEEDITDVTVRNCVFKDLLEDGVRYGVSNWRGGKWGSRAEGLRITDCRFTNTANGAIRIGSDTHNNRIIKSVEVLRNKVYNSGMRHRSNVQSSVQAINVGFPQTGCVAGNIVQRSFGSGIMVHGGAGGRYKYPDRSHTKVDVFPLGRILVFQNKTADTALGVNDYGGMSLWQGGAIYCFNNNIGNSPGVMPGGISWFRTPPTNLSYPLYLDGAYKIYSFNNIIWARSNDLSRDKYATKTPGYFMVFGFLNHLVQNTFYRTGSGVGGSAGHRNDVLGNVFSEVGTVSKEGQPIGKFIANDRTGDPSLIGGGDTGDSGRRGVPTLAFGHNVFHGRATAGRLLKPGRFGPDSPGVEAETIEELAEDMKGFPIRLGQLGWQTQKNPIIGKGSPAAIQEIGEVDFRPSSDSMAVDKGVRYFIPWMLYGTVGEWQFTENHADPKSVIDYSWYMAEPHYHRMMYEFVPTADLTLSNGSLGDYVSSPSENWVKGAVRFDSARYASVSDDHLRADIELPVWPAKPDGTFGKPRDVPAGPLWQIPDPIGGNEKNPVFAKDAKFVFPGGKRRTLAISTENLLLEAIFRTEGQGAVMGKYDGKSGYRLCVNDSGKAVLEIAANGRDASVVSKAKVADGKWHHVLAEVDRETGWMTIYVDGKKDGESKAPLKADVSLDNPADFLVAKSTGMDAFEGDIDFLRVCHGTLADARTTIEELYAWQTDGPALRDLAGNEPRNQRDAGAMEKLD